MFEVQPNVTKEYILSRVSQEDIFEYYLDVRVQFKKQIINPLRGDKTPTCTFKRFGFKLIFRDWSEQKHMDCIDVVCRKFNINYGEALLLIANDFGLMDSGKNYIPIIRPPVIVEESKTTIGVSTQHFTYEDSSYLMSYYITPDVAKKFRCFSVKYLYINEILRYHYNRFDPAIAYFFGEKDGIQQWKVYFYNRPKDMSKGPKFMGNTRIINGIHQLPKSGKVCVITKSMKDVMVLNLLDVPAIALQSETVYPTKKLIEFLSERFERIFSLYDYDLTGVRMANWMRKNFDIQPFFLTGDNRIKDISDYIKVNGLDNTKQLIQSAKRYYEI